MILGADKHRELPPRRWWVCFRDRLTERERRWWDWFTTPGFRHCFAFSELTPGQVIALDPLGGGVHVILIPQRPDVLIATMREKGCRVLVAKCAPRDHTPGPIRRGLGVTCASYLAYTLGLDGRPLTPRQLWSLLIRQGAKELGDAIR